MAVRVRPAQPRLHGALQAQADPPGRGGPRLRLGRSPHADHRRYAPAGIPPPGPSSPPDVGKPGERTLPFGRQILIERDDFTQDPPAGYQRLAPGRTVRLRHGYCITCDEVVEEGGEVVELRCSHLPGSVGQTPPHVKVSGLIHWVSAPAAVP